MIKPEFNATSKSQSLSEQNPIRHSLVEHKANKSINKTQLSPKDFAQRELPSKQKQEFSFINKLSCYSILLLSSLGIISCESAQKSTLAEETKVETPGFEEVEIPKFAKESNIGPVSFLEQPSQESPKPTIEEKQTTNADDQIQKPKEKKVIVKIERKANTDHEIFYYPDRDPEKFQEIISKFKFTIEAHTIKEFTNSFVAKLPKITKLIKHNPIQDEYILYSNPHADKEIARIKNYFKADQNYKTATYFDIQPSNSELFSQISESLYYTPEGDIQSKTYIIQYTNSKEYLKINKTQDHVRITKYNEHPITNSPNIYPEGYQVIEEFYTETFDKVRSKREEEFEQVLQEVVSPEKFLPRVQIKSWGKTQDEIKKNYHIEFERHPLGLIYNLDFFSTLNDHAKVKAKLINIDGQHFLLEATYRSTYFTDYTIECLEENLANLSSKQDFPLYKFSITPKAGQEKKSMLVNLNLEHNKFPYSNHTKPLSEYNTERLSASLHRNTIPWNQVGKLPKQVSRIEFSPANDKNKKTIIKNYGHYSSKDVLENEKQVISELTKQTYKQDKLRHIREFREYLNSNQQANFIYLNHEEIDHSNDSSTKIKLNTYRIINLPNNKKIIYKLEAEQTRDNYDKVLSSNKSFSLNNKKINLENKKELSKSIKEKLIKQIEPALDKFLDTILKRYQKEIDEFGTFSSSIRSILRSEQREILAKNLNTDHIVDEATAFKAYADAIEAIQYYFIGLCTKDDYDGKTNSMKSRLTTKLENSIPKVPLLGTYIIDPAAVEKLMRQIYSDLDIHIIPVAYEQLAKALKIKALPNTESIFEEIESFKQQITDKEKK